MLPYTDVEISNLQARCAAALSALSSARSMAMAFEKNLKTEQARSYVTLGVVRRLNILERCIQNVFRLFPLGHTQRLDDDVVSDLMINLHAFIINVAGLADNLAWAFTYENNIKIKRERISLFKEDLVGQLPQQVRDLLDSPHLTDWHKTYAKDSRDTIAHRVPLHIAPAAYSIEDVLEDKRLADEIAKALLDDVAIIPNLEAERASLGVAAPYFFNTFGPTPPDGRQVMSLHEQLLEDAEIAAELTRAFAKRDFKA